MNSQSPSKKQACESCRFFRTAPLRPDMGTCRVNPPSGVMVPMGNELAVQGFWPPTPLGEWCGKWETVPLVEGAIQAR